MRLGVRFQRGYVSHRGGKPLQGQVEISGAKNAALPAIFASLLTDEPLVLARVPRLRDVETAVELVRALGKEVTWRGNRLRIEERGRLKERAPEEPVRRMRASFLALGPLLARLGRAIVPHPGGCNIGPRPVDLHLSGLAALGAEITAHDGWVEAEAGRLEGTVVELSFPSVGATEQLLLAGALAEGETRIVNPAREPEVEDLARLLSRMGAETSWKDEFLSIRGARELAGGTWEIIPDRIEAGTYLLAGAITRGEVKVTGVIPGHLASLTEKLREIGVEVEEGLDWLAARARERPRATELVTAPYPGFPTDLQPPLVSLLTLASGESRVEERVFKNRFGHVPGLREMGASIEQVGSTLLITGVEELTGAKVEAPDIRAGAALVLAGLAARGTTYLTGLEHLDRGYENLVGKLRGLGAEICRGESCS